VTGFFGAGTGDKGSRRPAGDLFQGTGDPGGVARELYGRRIGQEFPLSGHGALDQLAEKDADVTYDHKQEGEQQERLNSFTPGLVMSVAAGGHISDLAAGNGEEKQPMDGPHELHVEAHVAV